MTSLIGQTGMRGPTGIQAGQRLQGPYQGQKLAGGYKQGQMNNFTPEQMNLFQSLFSQVSPDSYTGRLANGDQGLFDEMEAPALRQFNQMQGNLASRFSFGGGQGSLSGRRSSGFQNASNAQASNFAEQLQGNRQGLQRQAIQDLMSMSQSLLGQKPYENYLVEPKKNFLQQLLGGVSGGVGQAIGNSASGGKDFLSSLFSLFGGK